MDKHTAQKIVIDEISAYVGKKGRLPRRITMNWTLFDMLDKQRTIHGVPVHIDSRRQTADPMGDS